MAPTVLILLAILFAVFCWYAYDATRQPKTLTAFFLMDGRLKLADFSGSLIATNLSLGNFIFLGAIWGYFYGFSAIFWLFIGFCLLAAGFLIYSPFLKSFIEDKHNSGTIHHYIYLHYGSKTSRGEFLRLVSSLVTAIALLIAIMLEVHLGALIASSVLGGSIFVWTVAISLTVALYSISGGYINVVHTDFWQGLLLLAGALLLPILIFYLLPITLSSADLATLYSTSPGRILFDFGWANIVGFSVLMFGWFLITMDTWQRNCATRSVNMSRAGIAAGTTALFLFMAVYATLGMYSHAVILPFAEMHGLSHSGGYNPVSDLLTLAPFSASTVSILLGFVAVGFIMAAVSTTDTFLVVTGHTLTSDAYLAWFKGKELGDLDERDSINYTRAARVLILFLALIIPLLWLMFNALALLGDPVTVFFIAYSVQFALLAPVLLVPSRRRPPVEFVAGAIAMSALITLSLGIWSAYLLNAGLPSPIPLEPEEMLALSPIMAVGVGMLIMLVGRNFASEA